MGVLVTGAAGLIGGEVAGRLAAAGLEPAGLVNRNPEVRRNDGAPVDIRTLKGDVTKERLGLEDDAWSELVRGTDMIVHLAAVTDFTEENARHRAVNVEGTRNVLALAEASGARLVHVSTAYVAGDREGVILEHELDAGQGFTNGYESTKAEAERMVRKSGLPCAVARPSIVLGDHAEGRTRSFDTIYPILKVFAEGRVTAMPARPWATLDLVPIDHVAAGIEEMVLRFAEAEGRTFHLVAERPTPLSAFPETLASFEGLHAPAWVDPGHFDKGSLKPSERRFFERGAAVYARYFSRNPRFDDRQAAAFLKRRCPPTDADWWRRVVAYAIEAGFIRPKKDKR